LQSSIYWMHKINRIPENHKKWQKNCVIGELFIAMVGIRLQYS